MGKNGAGKTSILEAFSLFARVSPLEHQRLGEWRGLMQASQMIETVFHDLDFTKTILLSDRSEEGITKLSIAALSRADAQGVINRYPVAEPTGISELEEPSELFGLIHNYKEPKYPNIEWRLALHRNHFHFSNPSNTFNSLGSFYIHARRPSSINETARMLTELSRLDEQHLVDILQHLEPDIQSLRVGYSHEQVNVFADFADGKRLPLNVLGDGLSRVVLMLTGAFGSKSKLLIIDEIDSGLHYSAMATMWKSLLKLSQEHDRQIFCTTHSEEMLQATLEAFENHQDDLGIYRIARQSGETKAQKYDYELYRDAEIAGFPVR